VSAWWRGTPGRGSWAADAVVTVAIGAFAVLIAQPAAAGQVPPRRPLDLLAYLLIGVAAAALLLRRSRPEATLAVTVSAMVAYFATGYPYGPTVLAMTVAMYSVSESLGIRRSLLVCLAATVAVIAAQLVGLASARPLTDVAAAVGGGVSWLVPAWAVGAMIRIQRAADDLRRADEVRRQMYEERLRIAREVHDVVGHGYAVIAMQAGVALHVFQRRPDQAREALESIRTRSRAGLDDLRGTLELLPAGDDGRAPRRPTPGIAALDSLISATSDSGVPVRLQVTGERCELPAAVDHAAYRIIQESLTNVLRHAVPATATVRVDYHPEQLMVEVTDSGRHPPGNGSGNGIAGMRARADAVGGELTAGPCPHGGFRVIARLPLHPPMS
jgi:signal transduction histidine kinase